MQTLPEGITIDKACLELSEAADRKLRLAQQALEQIVDELAEAEASFAQRERLLMQVSNEACRRSLRDALQVQADALESEYIRVDGKLYRRHQQGSARYHSLCGSMWVRRATYRAVGVRNGPTIVPLELRAGLIARATPAMAYRAALGDAQCPGRQWEQQLKASLRVPPSRSTLERIAKTLGAQAAGATLTIEPKVRELETLPKCAHALALGLDRTTVPMEEPRRGPADPCRRRRTKPYVRAKPRAIEVNYRMAYVGTVTINDAAGEPLSTFRYSASADEGPDRVVQSMMADLQHVQRTRRRQRRAPVVVGVVQDAAPELWSLIEDALRGCGLDTWHCGIDRFHLTERLAQSLQLLPLQKVERERRLAQWRHDLGHDDRAIDRIEQYLARQIRDYDRNCKLAHRPAVFADLRTLIDHLKYIRSHRDKMRYASLRAVGLPTGSGTTEGACKSLVMIRAKRCGQRWRPKGIKAVLTLRGLLMSNRLDNFWNAFAAHRRPEICPAA